MRDRYKLHVIIIQRLFNGYSIVRWFDDDDYNGIVQRFITTKRNDDGLAE